MGEWYSVSAGIYGAIFIEIAISTIDIQPIKAKGENGSNTDFPFRATV